MEGLSGKMGCFVRAYHNFHSPAPVFADEYARRLLGEEYEDLARTMLRALPFFLPRFRGQPEEGLGWVVEELLAPAELARCAYREEALATERRLGKNIQVPQRVRYVLAVKK